MAERVQLRRTKGYRKPPGAVVVARPSKWGNPYRGEGAAEAFDTELRSTITDPWGSPHPIEFRVIAESIGALRGHDLACWCPVGQPCHADALLEIANS